MWPCQLLRVHFFYLLSCSYPPPWQARVGRVAASEAAVAGSPSQAVKASFVSDMERARTSLMMLQRDLDNYIVTAASVSGADGANGSPALTAVPVTPTPPPRLAMASDTSSDRSGSDVGDNSSALLVSDLAGGEATP